MDHQRFATNLLKKADISIGGDCPWDIQVHNGGFYKRILTEGTLGLGESYMDGWWDAKEIDQVTYRILHHNLPKKVTVNVEVVRLALRWTLFNMQSRMRARKVIQIHYDLSSKFYEQFLGPYNQYTSLYYKSTNSFEKAERQRLELITKKLQLNKNDRVLDIGCGWGGFAKYVATKYKCHVTGITISKEQAAYARKITQGLPVKIVIQDYRDLKGTFTKIFSGGMIEHVGYKNYRTYMKIVGACLTPDGLFLLDTLGDNGSTKRSDPWVDKYIFPNSQAPSAAQITAAAEDIFTLEDWHSFGLDYARTCKDWFKRFDKNWKNIQALDPQFNERFYRMWKYYLLAFAGALRARTIHQWQVVFAKRGLKGSYKTVR